MTKKITPRNGRTQQRRSDDELPTTDISDDDNRGTSFVLYGRSNTGKTTLAGTFPKKLLYIDVKDRGARSIRDVKGIRKRTIADLAEYEDTYWWLKEHPDVYETVVTDTVSQLQSMVVQEIFSAGRKKGSRKAGDWGSMTKRDWGDVSAIMKEQIINYRDLVDLGMNVVFIAQDRAFNFGDDDDADDEQTLAPEIGPALSPSIAKTLNAAVDVIGNTFIRSRWVTLKPKEGQKKGREVERIEYCLRVGPNSTYVTKVRKPKSIKVPDIIVDPDYEDIMNAIEGDE